MEMPWVWSSGLKEGWGSSCWGLDHKGGTEWTDSVHWADLFLALTMGPLHTCTPHCEEVCHVTDWETTHTEKLTCSTSQSWGEPELAFKWWKSGSKGLGHDCYAILLCEGGAMLSAGPMSRKGRSRKAAIGWRDASWGPCHTPYERESRWWEDGSNGKEYEVWAH